jgi:hypothetical protein
MTSGAATPGTFLLGVGCQKGGTAWMHRYLEASPQCDPGFRKEYHVWDGLDLPSGRLARERVMQQARRAATALEAGEAAHAEALLRASFYADADAYFDYFTALLRRPDIRLTADITPGYSGLSVQRLAAIREGFERRGVRPVAVYLMRDPVERIWSAARMDLRREGFPEPAEDRVLRMHVRDMYASRTRYDETMSRLEQAFPRESIFYGFYERLFDRETLRALCEFLGIDFHEPDFERQVNVSPKDVQELPEATVRTVAGHFRDVYDAVSARFPDLDLAAMWPSMRQL